jgi:hypothetical protein
MGEAEILWEDVSRGGSSEGERKRLSRVMGSIWACEAWRIVLEGDGKPIS